MDREKQTGGETRAGGRQEPAPGTGRASALEMLDAFAGVGARQFDITHTDIDQGRRGFRRGQTLEQTRRSLPFLVEGAARRQNSGRAAYIQLDDLTPEGLGRVRPVAFLVLETSPDNFQAWVAVAGADKDFASRLRKGTGADPTASGATRLAGTHNYKRKYEANFPMITVIDKHPGLTVTPPELEELWLVAAPEVRATSPTRAGSPKDHGGGWPSYQKCLDNAPEARGGGRADVSRADFTFALIAIDWGRNPEEVAARLMEESPKARADGRRYAELTARNAAKAVAARGKG